MCTLSGAIPLGILVVIFSMNITKKLTENSPASSHIQKKKMPHLAGSDINRLTDHAGLVSREPFISGQKYRGNLGHKKRSNVPRLCENSVGGYNHTFNRWAIQ